MPEGHTLHRLARDHTALLGGQVVRVSSPQGRFTDAAEVDGQRFVRAEAYGKHLFHHYANRRVIHVHLGLFGKFTTRKRRTEPTATVRLRIDAGDATIDLTGPTACALVTPAERKALLARLGPDPLRDDADPALAWARIEGKTTPIGVALLDQSVLAGVGNVYRAEVLFVHGLHPARPCSSVKRRTFESMWDWLVVQLRRGVELDRIVTADAPDDGAPKPGHGRTGALFVYHRRRCRECGGPIRDWVLAGRRAWACEHCQPP